MARGKRTRRGARSRAAASSDSATTAAVVAKTICAIVTSSTTSGYAENDECESEGDNGCGKRAQGALRLLAEGLA